MNLDVDLLGRGAGTREPRFEAGALVEHLDDFHIARGAVGDFRLDGRQSLEGRTKGDVQHGDSFARREFSQQRAVNDFAPLGAARTGELLQDLPRF